MNTNSALGPITELMSSIAEFESSLFPPTADPAENDEIIGECPEDLRKFFAYARCCEREMKQLSVDMEYSTERDDQSRYRCFQLNKKHDVALALFWFGLWEHFQAYGQPKLLGIRSQWRVVLSEQRAPQLPAFLRGFIGGIE
jgi:hypothetical protein